ncbi:MAG: hypothetical protein H6821_15320 [Planctomycetaceae bacterium]|nr:hypothetical protein [Planctomycetales bacterium]MCB9875541.1 hypothetical protein [Planctomycetaceae bacterium]
MRRLITTAMLALSLCALSTTSTKAQEYAVGTASEQGFQPRTGVPTLPATWHPKHWLHPDPNDPVRSTGIGNPLKGTSWRNRPFHIGWMIGGLIGDTLIDGSVDQKDGLYGGYRLGWDFDHYWGTELRYAFAAQELVDLQGTVPLASGADYFWDINLLYYPWGDAEWRPFASVGLGVAAFGFKDANQTQYDEALLTIPIGIGVKHYYRPWLALRTSLVDNLSFGSQGLDTMHNVSLSFGVEAHFGGPRNTYFPYHGGGMIW